MNAALANTNDSARANQRGNARRSDQLDAGAVGTVSPVGDVSASLRPAAKAAKERDEESYITDAFAKGLKVFECFQGRNFEPVTINLAVQRTGYPRSYCRQALITLKRLGWAKEIQNGRERAFVLGHKFENMARGYAAAALKRAD